MLFVLLFALVVHRVRIVFVVVLLCFVVFVVAMLLCHCMRRCCGLLAISCLLAFVVGFCCWFLVCCFLCFQCCLLVFVVGFRLDISINRSSNKGAVTKEHSDKEYLIRCCGERSTDSNASNK